MVQGVTRFMGSLAALACVAAVGGCSGFRSGSEDWTNFGNDGREQHFSPANEITAGNVADLKLAWHYDLEPGFTVSAPVEANGKLFVTTGHSHVRAFDATSGKLTGPH